MTRPLPKPVTLRTAIADSISRLKSYDVKDFCDRIGLPQLDEREGHPHDSKAAFVRGRLSAMDSPALVQIALRVLREMDAPELEAMVTGLSGRGVNGEMINLIFAADGPKPHIVLRDAINNQIEITRNAQHCLVYDRPLLEEGLTWGALVDWWVTKTAPAGQEPDRHNGARALWQRLHRSLASDPERMLFRTYATRYGTQNGTQLPALLPQVYLHYDPFAEFGQGSLFRQRMDFLLLLPNRIRLVLEIDGQHHYSKDNRPDPARYASMVSEDRRLRLAGYEVYRFGGHEFIDTDQATADLATFFDQLLSTHLGAHAASTPPR